MKKIIVLVLFAVVFSSTAMEQNNNAISEIKLTNAPVTNSEKITLVSKEGKEFPILREKAEQSPVLKACLEHESKEKKRKRIELPTIESDELSVVSSLLEKSEPQQKRIKRSLIEQRYK